MKATNGIGFHVECHDNIMGWRRSSKVMDTEGEAQAALKVANEAGAADAKARGTVDKVNRRWQESLRGFHDLPQ